MIKRSAGMFQIGDRVLYNNIIYFVISRPFAGQMEVAPTKHGAGGFMVLPEWLTKVASQ
jgi:hypothetical protein